MRFLADESLDLPIVKHLREEGLDVLSVSELRPSIDDEEVLLWANNEGRTLITIDKDFGELVFRLDKVHTGIILLRLDQVPLNRKIELLVDLIRKNENELLNSFIVVQENLIRIRQKK